MIKPNHEMIARAMLYSQGFKIAEKLSGKIVSLFEQWGDQLSNQPHYDFGQIALKSVLVSTGNFKSAERDKQNNWIEGSESEKNILISSVCDTVIPKLIAEDTSLFSLLSGVFPGSDIMKIEEEELIDWVKKL